MKICQAHCMNAVCPHHPQNTDVYEYFSDMSEGKIAISDDFSKDCKDYVPDGKAILDELTAEAQKLGLY